MIAIRLISDFSMAPNEARRQWNDWNNILKDLIENQLRMCNR